MMVQNISAATQYQINKKVVLFFAVVSKDG